MPRVVNGALAVFLLAFVAPIVTRLDGKDLWLQVALVLIVLPIVLVAGLCLTSALRPGTLGRAARKARARRQR